MTDFPSLSLSIDDQVTLYKEASKAYYTAGGSPILPDAEFDALNENLIMELGEDVLAEMVGFIGAELDIPEGRKRELEQPMLSLRKVHTEDQINSWFDSLDMPSNTKLSVHYKWDGLACLVKCDKAGNVIHATTRGNGSIGEDVTATVKEFWSPEYSLDPVTGEFRELVAGEVLLSWDEMNLINDNAEYDVQYNHPRNAASGILRKISSTVLAKHLTWKSHEAPGKPARKRNVMRIIEGLVNEPDHTLPTDGIVIKIEDTAIREELGFNRKGPNWAVAYKLPDQLQETTLIAVEWKQRRTKNAPTAVFETVVIDGTNVSRASLHNINIIRDLDLWIGDKILVRKANQIIPYIEGVASPGGRREDQRIEEEAGLVDFGDYINNVLDVMEIKGIGPAGVETLMSNGLIDSTSIVTGVTSLLSLDPEVLEKLDRFGPRVARNVCYSITSGFNSREGWRWLAALGMKGVGKTVSEKVTQVVDYADLEHVELETLQAIEGVGPVTAQAIYDSRELFADLIFNLVLYGISVKSNTGAVIESPLNGKSVVISGDMGIERKALAAMLKDRGAVVKTSVSKKTDLVLVGPGSGNKKDKAYELGVQIIGPEELDDLLEGKIVPNSKS